MTISKKTLQYWLTQVKQKMRNLLKENIIRLYRALRYSIDGIIAQWHKEYAFRQEVYLSLVATPIILILKVPAIVKLILVLLLMLLLVVETINSSLETIVDRISLDRHEQSKIAKDMGSAAVSITIIMNVLAWIYALVSLATGAF